MVLLANHQSEADPAVFALLLEKALPRLAQGAARATAVAAGWPRGD